MKKLLLFGAAMVSVLSGIAQQPRQMPAVQSGIINMAERDLQRKQVTEPASNPTPLAPTGGNVNSVENAKSSAATTVTWNPISGSINIYGMINANSKPLCYNPALNMVSFVHRKSNTYLMSPAPTTTGAISGGIVAQVTKNWGTKWDSTLIWNNSTQWARYPQGGLWNSAPTNTVDTNAYVLGMGPVTSNSNGWAGSFFASKKLNAYNNVASTDANAQVWFPNSAPYNSQTGNFKWEFPNLDFASTTDGVVRALGYIAKDGNATTSAAFGVRGARIIKGQFNSGVFNWTTDSIIPSVKMMTTDGYKMMFRDPHMCWNSSGTIGYVFFIGVDSLNLNTTDTSKWGYQPIVYKTTNSGNTWTKLNSIDFTNYTAFKDVLDHIFPPNTSNTEVIPFFTNSEGIDGIVDINGDLHIVSTVVGTARAHKDSLGYTWQYNQGGVTGYTYPHRTGLRPTYYDFTYNSTASDWRVTVIDSMLSEGPGTAATDPGYNENPWDPSTGKVDCSARLQLSRTPDGKHILYSWAESDTAYTDNNSKWNMVPDVFVRAASVGASGSMTLHPTKINVSESKNQIRQKATNHYISPVCDAAVVNTTLCTTAPLAFCVPMTVSNNTYSPKMRQDLPVTHWYSSAILNFSNSNCNLYYPKTTFTIDAISENALQVAFNVFPNPASGSVSVKINAGFSSSATISVMNIAGQVVSTVPVQIAAGDNAYQLDLGKMSAGVYFVTVRTSNGAVTQKLIVE